MPKMYVKKIIPKINSEKIDTNKMIPKKFKPKIIFQPHENYGQTPLPSVTSFVPTSTPMPPTIPSTTVPSTASTIPSTMPSTMPSTPSPLSSGKVLDL